MRRMTVTVSLITALTLINLLNLGRPANVVADTANVPSLTISQIKITSSNGQFVTLYNATNSTLDMSKYQLEYFNNYDLSKASSSRLIPLSGSLPPHGYYMVNDSALLLCYQLTVNSVSLGFSSTAGMVEVLSFGQSSPGSAATPVLQDYVGWSKTAAAGAQTLPSNTNAFLQRLPVDAGNNPAIGAVGAGSWQQVQPDPINPCKLTTTASSSTPVATGLSQLLPATEPPATIVNSDAVDTDGTVPTTPKLPAADIGLMASQITELLPNPEGTGNDSSDEYIEVYNPNAMPFDLSGFVLQSGMTTLHNYVFPAGTILPPKGFKAFYSETTGLSLSNTSGMVRLLEPSGNSISTTAAYSNAKDGQAWALANGKWYWTTSITPNAANVIKQPATAKKSSASASKSKVAARPKTSKPKTKKTSAAGSQQSFNDQPTTTPIHFWALALIGAVGISYGIYEYRADLANRIYQLRQNLRARRGARSEP